MTDTRGFDVLNGVSFLCHFTNRVPEHDRRSEEYLLKISDHRKTYALPEEDTLFLNETRMEEIIDSPFYKNYASHTTSEGKTESFITGSMKKVLVCAIAGIVIACGLWFISAIAPEFRSKKEKEFPVKEAAEE